MSLKKGFRFATMVWSMPNTPYQPDWKKHEAGLFHPDPKVQQEASDKFEAERDHALKTDPAARRWEKSRKESVAKDKPHFVKERLAKEKAEINQFNVGLRKAGSFDNGLRPSPGYLIVEIEKQEEKTSAGIYLPAETSEVMQNTGRVVDLGDPLPFSDNRDLPLPCQVGDKVMFKKGAGIELDMENRNCRFMLQSDILGVFYEATQS